MGEDRWPKIAQNYKTRHKVQNEDLKHIVLNGLKKIPERGLENFHWHDIVKLVKARRNRLIVTYIEINFNVYGRHNVTSVPVYSLAYMGK
jgi:hypothetical protein